MPRYEHKAYAPRSPSGSMPRYGRDLFARILPRFRGRFFFLKKLLTFLKKRGMLET
jgi:hypothetical protein